MTSDASNASRRSPWQAPAHKRFFIRIAVFFIRLYGMTFRYQPLDEDAQKVFAYKGSRVVAFWHNRLFFASAAVQTQKYLGDKPMYGLVSASRDGALLSAFLEALKIIPIRGSAFRRSLQSYREMLKAVHESGDIIITPDGSRGPMYTFHKGAARLALSAGCPVVLASWNSKKPWRLKTWDKFQIPKPFSKITLRVKWIDPLQVQAYEDSHELATVLERELKSLCNESSEENAGKI